MATLASTSLTMMDWAKRIDPQGKTATIVELLNQTNDIITDALWKEGNLATGNRTVQRTSLPTVYFRKLNSGVPLSKSTTRTIDDACAFMEARSHCDVRVANLNGDVKAYRLSESSAFLEAMNQTFATTLFYGNAYANEEQFHGIMTRYNSLSGTIGQNVLSAGGAGSDNTSIVLVGWGDQGITGLFPKGSKVGLQHQDLGIDDVQDANGNWFQAYKDLFTWDVGLSVKDWRYIVRIANIDVSDFIGITGTQATTASTNVLRMMARALIRLPSKKLVKPVFYVNRTVASALTIMAMEKTSNVLSIEQGLSQLGNLWDNMRFMGVPIRTCDAILNTESVVS